MKKIITFLSLVLALAWPKISLAHCPLCTLGAGAAAGVAMWLGVKTGVIGLFLGAAALSLGWWFGRVLKRRYLPLQTPLISLVSFASIILPVSPLMAGTSSIYVSWWGDYGSVFNRTYLFDPFIAGAIIGALVLFVTPVLSRKLTKLRGGKIVPFQGIILTFTLLMIIGVYAQIKL